MRVLMLGWEFPPHISGGLGTACKGLVEGLAVHDVEVAFVVPRLHGDEAAVPARLVDSGGATVAQVAVDSALSPYASSDEYTRRATAQGSHAPYAADVIDEVTRYAEQVRDLIHQEPCDIVHAHDWMTFPAGAAAAKTAGVPLVVHVHSCEHDRSGDDADARVVRIEQEGFDAADRVVCVSRATANRLRSLYTITPGKLCVVHNATPSPRSEPAREVTPRVAEPVVLFLGRITAQKGPHTFLEAAARVIEDVPDVRFVMAGSGPLLPTIVERAAAMGLARHVRFTGFLRGDEVDRIYDEAALYVLPSVSEPFGIAPLEALARDVPAIVSKQSGVAEVLSNVLTVDFWDVDELAATIVSVLQSPDVGRDLAAKGGVEARALTWADQAGSLVEVYGEVLA